jgi:hypothetical protein
MGSGTVRCFVIRRSVRALAPTRAWGACRACSKNASRGPHR